MFEESSTPAVDGNTTNNNHLTWVSASQDAVKFVQGAASIAGSAADDDVALRAFASLNGNFPFKATTLEYTFGTRAYFKASPTGGTILRFGNLSNQGFWLFIQGDGTVRCITYSAGGTASIVSNAAMPGTAGWHSVVMRWNGENRASSGANDEISMWIDGVKQSTTFTRTSVALVTASDLRFYVDATNGVSNHDEGFFFDVALTDAQILDIHNDGIAGSLGGGGGFAVDAGSDQNVSFAAQPVALAATPSGGTPTHGFWSKISGPGEAAFAHDDFNASFETGDVSEWTGDGGASQVGDGFVSNSSSHPHSGQYAWVAFNDAVGLAEAKLLRWRFDLLEGIYSSWYYWPSSYDLGDVGGGYDNIFQFKQETAPFDPTWIVVGKNFSGTDRFGIHDYAGADIADTGVAIPKDEAFQLVGFMRAHASTGRLIVWLVRASGTTLLVDENNIDTLSGDPTPSLMWGVGNYTADSTGFNKSLYIDDTAVTDDMDTASTTVTFSEPGVYVLRYTSYDGTTTAFDDVEITVEDVPPPATCAVTGTATASITEGNVVSGGKTIILTMTGDTWVAAGGTFDAQRQAIIDGLDSAQSETNGWNNEVRDNLAVTSVVRTSNTVVTITLSAQAAYAITATETITVTVPGAALTGASPITAEPTFTVSPLPAGTAAITGTAASGADEAEIRAGGLTVIITLTGDTWVASGATFDAVRQDIILGLNSSSAGTFGWNNEVRDNLAVTSVVRTSATVVTVTLSAQAAYDISAAETITVSVPASAVTSGESIVATPTFTVTAINTGAEEGPPRRRRKRRLRIE